jgi:hypothetical protein
MAKLYVAVVDKETVDYRSARPRGDWAAFVDPDRDEAVGLALAARLRWGSHYRVLVGELTGEAREPVQYNIVELDAQP